MVATLTKGEVIWVHGTQTLVHAIMCTGGRDPLKQHFCALLAARLGPSNVPVLTVRPDAHVTAQASSAGLVPLRAHWAAAARYRLDCC